MIKKWIYTYNRKLALNRPLSERFWEKVDIKSENECWNWIAHLNACGYGCIGIDRKVCSSNRIAWELTYGRIPDGLCVCHRCDNPACCNPKHLFLGTVNDNAQDKIKKGRMSPLPGISNPSAKLNEKQVIEIRDLYLAGNISHMRLSKLYGMSKTQIGDICRRKSWKHI